MKKTSYIFLLLTLVFCGQTLAQSPPSIPPPPQYDPEVVALVDQAKSLMDKNDYEGANKAFRKALATKKVLPTSMSYYFAETLFVIHQNQNARNFVEKYIQLVGRGGDHYDEAVRLKQLIDDKFEEIRNCDYCNLTGYRYVLCDNCNGLGQTVEVCYNCHGNGLIMCPKCIGRGVIITLNPFGEQIYSSCDLCDSKGYITCDVCDGTKEIAGTCNVCLGTGKKVSNIICNHQETQ